jgi:hypothetical protein
MFLIPQELHNLHTWSLVAPDFTILIQMHMFDVAQVLLLCQVLLFAFNSTTWNFANKVCV